MASIQFMFGPMDKRVMTVEQPNVGYPIDINGGTTIIDQKVVSINHRYEFYHFYDGIYYYRYDNSRITSQKPLAKVSIGEAKELHQELMIQAGIIGMILREDDQDTPDEEDSHST